MSNTYKVTLLRGDGIGPEKIPVFYRIYRRADGRLRN